MLPALLALVALIAAACGSKLDEQARQEAIANEAEVEGTSSVNGETAAGEFPMVGTHELKCSPGDGDNTDPGIQGVTADTITIGTMADISGPQPGLMQPMWDAMDAFVNLCNRYGGINGRQLELVKIDTAMFEVAGAAAQACQDVFVTVGDGVVFDADGAQVQVDCGQVSVPGFTATAEKALSDLMWQAIPNPTNVFPAGPGKYISEQYPEEVKKAAMFYIPVGTTELNHDRMKEAYEEIGFEYIANDTINIVETEWKAVIEGLRDSGAEYVYDWADVVSAAQMVEAMEEVGWRPTVVDGGQQVYDQDLIEIAGDAAEGMLVYVTTYPFEEAEEGTAVQVYMDELAELEGSPEPAGLGVQGFSSAMLFAEAMHSLGNDISMENLADALSGITEWDGGGMHVPTNPADNSRPDCFMYMRVEGGQFVRHFPETREDGDVNGFVCYDDTIIELDQDIAQGASAG
ncbi:MAG: hypothetical protein JJLCMIEE_00900 [Acidimicrobiales bacterium]|nr:hypothetical protein [Acidimicrobiales bacterium]